ncbi:MAG: phosphotransferase [Pseudonocardiaceae bacterium]
MTTATFVKHYEDPQRSAAARAHRDWLAALDCPVRMPELHAASTNQLVFEHLGYRQPGPDDLGVLARALGTLHAAAHTSQLHAARLDVPFTTSGGLVITDFVTPRRELLDRMPVPWMGLPVAFYKDANIRNFLLTDTGAAIVDFDDLTLAPFGYDLAKLIVSTAMTHGHLDPDAVEAALEVYNTHIAEAGDTACPSERLRAYAEFHHLCTVRYLHRNGYRHAWPDVRPWPEPEVHQ